eukprot:3551621-Heterocapsa_arctica.AAC.1
MELVVFLENKLRAPEIIAETVAQQNGEGEQPVTCREFHAAIHDQHVEGHQQQYRAGKPGGGK